MRRALLAVGLAVLFFFAYITAIPLAFKMLYAAGLLIGLSWLWARLGARGLVLRRESPEGAYQVGEQFSEPLVLQNRAPLSLPWIEVIDRSSIPGYDAGRAISLGARRQRRWLSSGRFAARGRYLMGPVDIVTGDPFGFFQRSQRLPPTSAVVVYPRLVDVSSLLPGAARNSGDTSAAGRFVDSPPDAFGIREHDPSDGFNRIHWPSTARLGRPMSKTFEKFEGSDVMVVLDLDGSAHRGAGVVSTIEYAASLAASVAADVVGRGQSVGLTCNDRRLTSLPPARGGGQLRRVLEYLAVAEANGTTSLDTMLAGLAQARGQQSVVVITPRGSGRWIDRLTEVGRAGRRRSTVLHLVAESFVGAGGVASDSGEVAAEGISWYSFAAGDPLFATRPHHAEDLPVGIRPRMAS
ncbi:MAG TPA: DUF58 domain-containing protein [Candidatus Dormibacteraeota bacterium]|nr:DUF58 domain-containing protein [Candidatus Dormibacteraeota bacterium]